MAKSLLFSSGSSSSSGQPKPYTLQQLKEATDDFNELSFFIAKGRSADVFMGKFGSQTLGVKWFSNENDPSHIKWEKEVQSLLKLDHDNVIKVEGLCKSEEGYALLFPYIKGGNLREHLNKGRLSLESRISIAKAIAKAVAYIHEQSIIHADIKSENVLIDENLNPYLCDFEMSLLYNAEIPPTVPLYGVGTAGYRESNCSLGDEIHLSYDVYSFGVLLMEIVSGMFASSGYGEHLLAERCKEVLHISDDIEGKTTDVVRDEVAELFELCKACISKRANRPTMEDVASRLEGIYAKYHE